MVFKPKVILVFLCFLVFTLVCYLPFSLQPWRYSIMHRTASHGAMIMYYFNEYLHGKALMPFSYFNIWAYPEGGILKLIGIPSIAMGSVLCKWISPRTAFNLIFMANLIISGLSFYLVGRKTGLKRLSSVILRSNGEKIRN